MLILVVVVVMLQVMVVVAIGVAIQKTITGQRFLFHNDQRCQSRSHVLVVSGRLSVWCTNCAISKPKTPQNYGADIKMRHASAQQGHNTVWMDLHRKRESVYRDEQWFFVVKRFEITNSDLQKTEHWVDRGQRVCLCDGGSGNIQNIRVFKNQMCIYIYYTYKQRHIDVCCTTR